MEFESAPLELRFVRYFGRKRAQSDKWCFALFCGLEVLFLVKLLSRSLGEPIVAVSHFVLGGFAACFLYLAYLHQRVSVLHRDLLVLTWRCVGSILFVLYKHKTQQVDVGASQRPSFLFVLSRCTSVVYIVFCVIAFPLRAITHLPYGFTHAVATILWSTPLQCQPKQLNAISGLPFFERLTGCLRTYLTSKEYAFKAAVILVGNETRAASVFAFLTQLAGADGGAFALCKRTISVLEVVGFLATMIISVVVEMSYRRSFVATCEAPDIQVSTDLRIRAAYFPVQLVDKVAWSAALIVLRFIALGGSTTS